MTGGEPHEHPFLTKYDDNLYVFTALPCVEISFKKDKNTGKKTVELRANSRNSSLLPQFHFDANCFKRLVESNLSDMEEADL
jgi:hypothetical protein